MGLYSYNPIHSRASTGDACWRSGVRARGSGFVSRALGRPWVTVRPHYGGPPFSGLDGAGRTGRKPRARAGEEPAVRVPEATVPRPNIAAVERRKACAPPTRARLRLLRSYGGLESAEARSAEAEKRGGQGLRLPALHPLGFSEVGRNGRHAGAVKNPRGDAARPPVAARGRAAIVRRSSFETRASRAPQDEDLVLRRPRSGRLEGRQ